MEQSKRGSKSASIEANYNGDKSEIGRIVSNSFMWFKYDKVQSDEECADRLNMFFSTCCDEDNLPTVEKMALALGITRETLWRWENGEGVSPQRCNMIKKSKEILASIDAELVQKRKIPEITYIFRAKNYHKMHDKQEIVHTPNNPLGDITDEATLRQRYLSAVPDVD